MEGRYINLISYLKKGERERGSGKEKKIEGERERGSGHKIEGEKKKYRITKMP